MVLLYSPDEARDPRRVQGQCYQLAPLLVSIVLLVLSAATSFRKMAMYMAVQRDRINQLWGRTGNIRLPMVPSETFWWT